MKARPLMQLIGTIAILCGMPAFANETLPIENFAHLERISSVSISPDGRYLAIISAPKDRRTVAILDWRGEAKLTGAMGTDKYDQFDVDWCRWASDVRLLCGYRGTASDMGNHYPVTRMVAIDADGKNSKVLIQNSARGESQFQDDVIDWSPGIADTVLVQAVEPDSADNFPSVFALNVRTGSMRINTRARPPIRSFRTDHHGQVRLGWGYDDTKISYFGRLDGQREWRLLSKFEAFSQPENILTPFSVVAKTNTLFARGNSDGREALWKLDLEDHEEPSVVFSHPLVDVSSPLLAKDGRMLGVIYETEEPHAYYTDPYLRSVIEQVNRVVPGTFNTILDMTRDERTFVITSYSDTDAGRFFVFDSIHGTLQEVGAAFPDLPPEKMARMRWIHYPAGDSTPIPGYLTVPVGKKAEHLPLIVMPHGGPIARESFGFNFLTQFLANRGYAVLQMNFRGSDGYGSQWFHAAHQDWGGLTYSDITDATRWAIAQGIADPKRVCILGWSFGGYAALLGAVRNSDLYRCSVSIAGVSDLIELEFDARHFSNAAIARRQIGTDSDKLKKDSPRRHAAEVNIPILLVHGDRDFNVEQHHSKDMLSALKRAGKTVEFVDIDGGNHSLWREAERIKLLQSIEKFLAANLGAP